VDLQCCAHPHPACILRQSYRCHGPHMDIGESRTRAIA
jgi:hypothetical protein